MPVNNGKYTPPANNWHPAIAGRPMDPAGWNKLLDDLSEALSSVIYKDGQSKMTGNLDMGSHRITKLGKPQQNTDALRLKMLEKGEDIPSSETIDLPMEGMLFVITGDHDISTITSQFDGKLAFLQFEEAVSLVASENLILPGGSNYLTSAGEVLMFLSVSGDTAFLFPTSGSGGSDEDIWASVIAF